MERSRNLIKWFPKLLRIGLFPVIVTPSCGDNLKKNDHEKKRFIRLQIDPNVDKKPLIVKGKSILVSVSLKRGSIPNFTRIVCTTLLEVDDFGATQEDRKNLVRNNQITPDFFTLELENGEKYRSGLIKEDRSDLWHTQLVIDEKRHRNMNIEFYYKDFDNDGERDDLWIKVSLDSIVKEFFRK